MNITNTLLFFVEKMWQSFALQRILTFYQQKISVFAYIVGIYLTNWGHNDDVKLTKFWSTGPWAQVIFVPVNKTLNSQY